jgi:hypothetical protein
MPVKCSFCRNRDEHAGAYETHLQIAHANLDIVHASSIRNPPTDILNHRGTGLSDANKPIVHPDSHYKSDPAGDPPGSERDAHDDTFMQESDTETLQDNMSSVAAAQEDYPPAGEPIVEVRVYNEECSNSVRYGASGAPKNTGPRRNSPPRPAYRPGAGHIFRLPFLPPGARAPPHPYPGQAPVKSWW